MKIGQLTKDIKKYKFSLDDKKLKNRVKSSLLGISEVYTKYLKRAKPVNAYTIEDLEIGIDKMLKILN